MAPRSWIWGSIWSLRKYLPQFNMIIDTPTTNTPIYHQIERKPKDTAPGVCWDKHKKRWVVQPRINGQRVYLGRFVNRNEAIFVREMFLRQLKWIDLSLRILNQGAIVTFYHQPLREKIKKCIIVPACTLTWMIRTPSFSQPVLIGKPFVTIVQTVKFPIPTALHIHPSGHW